MTDDSQQDLYVQADAALFSFSGMSKDTVLGLLPGFGASAVFVDKKTYDAAIASVADVSAAAGSELSTDVSETGVSGVKVASTSDRLDALESRMTRLEAKIG